MEVSRDGLHGVIVQLFLIYRFERCDKLRAVFERNSSVVEIIRIVFIRVDSEYKIAEYAKLHGTDYQ